MSALQIIWFGLIAVLLVGYAILDGFDLGVGFWHLLARQEGTRRTFLTAIGPFWDGNEVWLLTAGGALFAAFPPVYATVFSGFYLALVVVLAALILRAVSLEWRAREATAAARNRWDVVFALCSIVATLLFGVAFGNILHGLPLDRVGNFTGAFFSLLNPFAVLIGLVNCAMLATHGALYLSLRTRGELAAQTRTWALRAWWTYLPLALVAVIAAIATQPHLLRNYIALPALWLLPALALLAILLIGRFTARGQAAPAFAASAAGIALLLIAAAAGLFPTLVPALGHPAWNLTVMDSSSPLTLTVMLIITFIGMVLVAIYTTWVYRTFSGPVQVDDHY
ncbi:MAG TPA: cytochrome d ubiquinol oxidase subunit II [Armatimonadota bacterium]|jgi:cytochrome d ubiquinol oxidase subunit II